MNIQNTTRRFVPGVLTACVLLAAAPGNAIAADGQESISDLVAATGLTKSEVQMVLGARTPHFEYFTSYARAQRRFVDVLGEQRYRDLMAGREIALGNGARIAIARN